MSKNTEKGKKVPKSVPQNSRRVSPGSYKSFRLQKKISGGPALPGAFSLFRQACGILARNWKLFGGIVLVYMVLNILLVQGLGMTTGLEDTKTSLEDRFTGGLAQLTTGATLFVFLVGSSGGLTPAAGVYQLMISLVVSLALIWTLRELYAGHRVRIRDGFYRGMYPFVPFVLILCVIGLQLVPLILGSMLYSTIVANEIAVSGAEITLWATIFFVMALFSLYLVCSSLFALYIASLPDVTPVQALRSARDLVKNRRWTVLRKVLFLPFAMAVIGAAIIIPLVLIATPIGAAAFFVLSMVGIAVVHSYMYGLYRSLL